MVEDRGHTAGYSAAVRYRPWSNGACPASPRTFTALLDDRALRGLVLRSLAAYDDPATPEIILRHYGEFSESERDDAIATLAARPAWAQALLESIGRGQIPAADVSVSIARQLQAFGDRRINEQLETVWGKVQPTSKAKAALMTKYKSLSPRPQNNRPICREVGSSLTGPASLATGSMTPAATSARN